MSGYPTTYSPATTSYFGYRKGVLEQMVQVFAASDVLAIGVVFLVAYCVTRRLRKKPKVVAVDAASLLADDPTRDIAAVIRNNERDCAVFFGSQTGTAEDFAGRLGKEAKGRFRLNTTIADVDEYDYDNFHRIARDKVYVFVLATYGDGEPTDNAAPFREVITSSNAPSLESLIFSVFGLGNSTYEHHQ
ncbi:NADPH-cytochrome p450 reductase [Colletotrichum musicola]|uniref:NADPH-cytochrome p450 reductase n=1 Tax=Colletotrichum musicola TaxID=2175873 RepID=A0A8H6MI18_9PEZI|nr:NADPH-cytochrome p450 reductase [Colletotrichum musicola]